MGNPLSRSKPKPAKKVRFNLVFENIIENQAIVLDKIYDITDNNTQANVYKRVKSLKRKHSEDMREEASLDKDLEPLASKKAHLAIMGDDELQADKNSSKENVENLVANVLSFQDKNIDDNNNSIINGKNFSYEIKKKFSIEEIENFDGKINLIKFENNFLLNFKINYIYLKKMNLFSLPTKQMKI